MEGVRQAVQHAEQAGVTLGLEYLNRFECYLLNHAADMIRFIKEVNHSRCRMIFDTFHGAIEEKDPLARSRRRALFNLGACFGE